MIELSRNSLRQVRAVLRRCGTAADPQREPPGRISGYSAAGPALRCRSGRAGLVLEAVFTEVAVRYQLEGTRPEASLTLPAAVLGQLEGRKDDPVTLERVSETAGRARWADDGTPRVLEFDLPAPDAVPPFPEVPRKFLAMPAGFGPGLAEAVRSTARDSIRFALTRVQLRGKNGALVGTDGRQLLLQKGFRFPWDEDLLIPAVGALVSKELLDQGPIGLGRTKNNVGLRWGNWTFLLAIDATGRFPEIDKVLPKARVPVSRLILDPGDAESVIGVLAKWPTKGEEQPVTLDLGTTPAIRFRVNDGPVTEVSLPRSTASGKPVRLASDRRFLLRALELGFQQIDIQGADSPLCCREAERIYVWMPLGKAAALPASADVLRVPAPDPQPREEERIPAMPPPSTNGHRPEDDRRNPPPGERPSLEELIAEAETLRTQLADAAQRTGRLVGALKQQRRHTRVLRTAIDSLRELKLGP